SGCLASTRSTGTSYELAPPRPPAPTNAAGSTRDGTTSQTVNATTTATPNATAATTARSRPSPSRRDRGRSWTPRAPPGETNHLAKTGGGRGIRTPGAHHPAVFKTAAFDRSAIPPASMIENAAGLG